MADNFPEKGAEMAVKFKNYKYGKFSFRTYHKSVGNGFEVGLTSGKRVLQKHMENF